MTRKQLAAYLIRSKMNELESAMRILWLFHRVEGSAGVASDKIHQFFVEHAISNPNKSRLQTKLSADRRILVDARSRLLRLRASALADLDSEMGAYEEENPISSFANRLEEHADKLLGQQTRSFVQEAIQCVKNNTPRAAIIMAWCGAVSVLQEYVFANYLQDFNADAVKNGLLKLPAQSLADMRDISKESQFLECLARISILDDASKRVLKRCLDRRNDVGHPSEVRLSDAAVADHIDTLILNVFEKFDRA